MTSKVDESVTVAAEHREAWTKTRLEVEGQRAARDLKDGRILFWLYIPAKDVILYIQHLAKKEDLTMISLNLALVVADQTKVMIMLK